MGKTEVSSHAPFGKSLEPALEKTFWQGLSRSLMIEILYSSIEMITFSLTSSLQSKAMLGTKKLSPATFQYVGKRSI